MRRWTIAIVAVALTAPACGGTEALTPEEEAVAAAIEARIASEIAEGDDLMDDVEARLCFAKGIVDVLGLARLADLGVSETAVADSGVVFGGMTDAELRDVADVAGGCVDLGASFQAEIQASGVSASGASCLVGGLEGSDFFQQAFVAGMLGQEFVPDQAALAAMVDAANECLTPGEVQILFGTG